MDSLILAVGFNLVISAASGVISCAFLQKIERSICNIVLKKSVLHQKQCIERWVYFTIGLAFVGYMLSDIVFWMSIITICISLSIGLTIYVQDRKVASPENSLKTTNPLLATIVKSLICNKTLNCVESSTFDNLLENYIYKNGSCNMNIDCTMMTGGNYKDCPNKKSCYVNSQMIDF